MFFAKKIIFSMLPAVYKQALVQHTGFVYTHQNMKANERRMIELIREGLALLAIEDPQEQLQNYLLRYLHELTVFNAAFNLVKAENDEALIIQHIFDSLAPWNLFAKTIAEHTESRPCRIADIGSGAGFPGVPLACLFLAQQSTAQFTLVERMQKRCAFLENVRAMLNLTNTGIAQVEAESAPADYFDIVAFRAFRPIDGSMLQTLQKRLCSTGFLAAYKGKRSAIDAELHALGAQKPEHRIIPLTVPFLNAERHLLIIPKA